MFVDPRREHARSRRANRSRLVLGDVSRARDGVLQQLSTTLAADAALRPTPSRRRQSDGSAEPAGTTARVRQARMS